MHFIKLRCSSAMWLSIALAVATLLATPQGSLRAQPVVNAVVSGASFDAWISPGCIISIFGSNLSESTASATGVPLPTTIRDVTVTVGEIDAPLYFVSPEQINAQVPFELGTGSVSLLVSTFGGASAPYVLRLTEAAPALFSKNATGEGPALYFDAGFQLLDKVTPGDTIIAYATGLGATNPPTITGAGGAIAEPLNRVVHLPEVFIGEQPAQVVFAGLAPGFVAVYQLNLIVPSMLGSDRLFIRTLNQQSNIVEVGVRPGENVQNVRAAIRAVNPQSETKAAPSPFLLVGEFSLSLEIKPFAELFLVAAVSEAGRSLIQIDPAAKTFVASATVPTAETRLFDFSQTNLKPVDLLNGGEPITGGRVPLARLDPETTGSLDLLPFPNASEPGGATALFQVADSLSGSSFTHCCPVKSRIESIGWGHRGIRLGSRMAGVPVKGAFFRIA